MKAVIREGMPGDIDALSQLLAGLFSLETDFVPDSANQIAGLRLLLTDRRRNVVFVAEDNGNLVGMVTGQLVISTAAGGYSVLIEDMVILEDYRRQGLGTALLRKAAAWGEKRGALRYQLLADRRNAPALDFYRNFGFQQSFMIGLYKIRQEEG